VHGRNSFCRCKLLQSLIPEDNKNINLCKTVWVVFTAIFTYLSPGHAAAVCGRPVWADLQHESPRHMSAAGHQVHVWLPGRPGPAPQHTGPGCRTHMEVQQVTITLSLSWGYYNHTLRQVAYLFNTVALCVQIHATLFVQVYAYPSFMNI